MKFGLFYEMVGRKPFDTASVVAMYKEAIEQIKLAEEVGFEYVWETEHHFLAPFSFSGAPEVFLSAVAQQTSTIRIGHGVVLLTLNHPVQIAEKTAVLDILSNGRLEVGTGRSQTEAELGGFLVEPEDSRPMWEESIRMLPKMWTADSFEHDGKYWKVPLRNVVPKPLQKPHPPLWVACSTPPTFELAGKMGLGVLSFAIAAPGQSEAGIKSYRAAIKNAEPVGMFVNEQVASFTPTVCLEDDAEARRVGAYSAVAYAQATKVIYKEWAKRGGHFGAWLGTDRYVPPRASPEEIDKLYREGAVCVGDPESCIRTLKKWESLGVDQIMCMVQAGRIAHDKAMATIRNFGRYIIPNFKRHTDKGAAAAV